ncbi:hypothetical protein Pan44_41610 [Caulifigura coniformis]|uniref:Uncharacterized protein n=1 Tax=Caulifigura coniformis TaxID=2527983 RepID=A0A517SJ09_9PLAN|nr:hypothetical protein [Caulifigura coniformis]QDT56110.1 hypothetical protein Pan44_41610 [Caulifigura coniformis]
MGFIKKSSRSNTRDAGVKKGRSSFEGVSENQLEEHLAIARYGSFRLTEAVRPSYDLQVVPSAGWRRDAYVDDIARVKVPVIIAAQTREKLFELFIDLLTPLGDEVDVVLETSHQSHGKRHKDMHRENIDLPILKSILYDYEEMLMNDGCTGIAVLNPSMPLEVQFDEHKLLVLYGHELEAFEGILEDHRLPVSDTIRFITEGEHVHSSSVEYGELFNEMKYRIGVEE